MTSTIKIAEKNCVTKTQRGSQTVWTVCASDMLLKPGEWPQTVAVRRYERWQKDVVLFSAPYPIMVGGRFQGMRYRGPGGITLEVLND